MLPAAPEDRLAGLALLLALLLAAAVAISLAGVGPCWAPGAGECDPERDRALELVPAAAGAGYLRFDLDPDSESGQAASAGRLAARVPALTGLVGGAIGPAAGFWRRIDYQRDVLPWSRGEPLVALFSSRGGRIDATLIAEIEDPEAALEFSNELLGPRPEVTPLAGVELRSGAGGLASAEREGFLIVGPGARVRESIELQPAASMAADAVAERALESLPEERYATAFASPGLTRALRRRAPLAALEALVDSEASAGVAAALSFDEDGVGLALRSVLEGAHADDGPFATWPRFDPTLTDRLKGDTLAYVGVGDGAAAAAPLFNAAASIAPSVLAPLARFGRRLERSGAVEIERDLLALLQGEAALSLESDPGPGDEPLEPEQIGVPYLALLAETGDAAAAAADLSARAAPIARATDDPDARGEGAGFEPREIAGVPAQVLPLSPVVELSIAAIGDELLVATRPAAIERDLSAAPSLGEEASFQEATSAFPERVSLLAYLDFRELLGLGERLLLAADPTYGRYAADLRTIEAAALAITYSPTELASDLRLVLAEERATGGPPPLGQSP